MANAENGSTRLHPRLPTDEIPAKVRAEVPVEIHRRRHSAKPLAQKLNLLLGLWVWLVVSVACQPTDLFFPPTPTPEPTREPAPTFTPTPESVQALLVVTPPSAGTPGVIIVPPGVDPSTLIPVPTPTPTQTPTVTPTSTPTTTSSPAPQSGVTIITPGAPAGQPESPLGPGIVVTSIVAQPIVTPDLATPDTTRATPAPTAVPVLPTPTVDRSRVVVFVPGPTPALPGVPPTETPTPLPTATPTSTPTPFVQVASGLVSLRSGPGVEYPLVAQLGPDIPISIVGRTPEGAWLQICCVNGESVWVAATHVDIVNDITSVSLQLPPGSPPPPTATPTPTDTPTVTPTPTSTPYPFEVTEGPLFLPTNNEFLSIWVKVHVGPADNAQPLPGYFLNVEFRARPEGSAWDSRPNTRGEAPSTDYFDFSAPAGPAGGNRVQFNYKYEFTPPNPRAENPNATETRLTLIDGYWRIYLTDGSGIQLTDYIQFDTLGGNPNREVYVAWSPR